MSDDTRFYRLGDTISPEKFIRAVCEDAGESFPGRWRHVRVSDAPASPVRRGGLLAEYVDEGGRQYFVPLGATAAFESATNPVRRLTLAHLVVDKYGVAKNRGAA